jgi:hypothetical protein
MERRMNFVPSVFCEQFVHTTGLARASKHGVHLRNERRRFCHCIPN